MRGGAGAMVLLLHGVAAALVGLGRAADARDETCMLQQQLSVEQPSPEVFTQHMRSWLDGFYTIVRAKGDEWLSKCCDLHRETGIDPWQSWGTATEEQQKIWQDSNCNAIVGSAEEDIGIGAPNCVRGTYDSLLRAKPASVALHQQTEGCDDIDRESIDDEYFDRDSIPNTMSIECSTEHIVQAGLVNFTQLMACTKTVLKLSDTCTGCYMDFIKNVGGDGDAAGCFTTCYQLSYCRKKDQCTKKAKACAVCAQPALVEYDRCVGGTIHNGITIDGFFKKMLRYSPH